MDKKKGRVPTTRPQSFITHPIEFTLTWTILIVLSPILIPVLISIVAYRFTIRLIGQHLANLVSPLTPYDCIFAVDSYHTRPYASNLTVLELTSRLDIETLRRSFKTRILDNESFSKLRYIPVEFMGYWFWKDLGSVDIESCVKVYHDSELEIGQFGDKDVDDCLREIVEMPYKNELFNVCLLHFGKKSLVVFRIHHTVCDGYSFNHLIDTFVGLESKYLVKEKNVAGGFECTRGFFDGLFEMLREFKNIIILLLHLPLHVSTLYRESLTHTPNFYTLRKKATTGTIRRTILPLTQVKRVRQSTSSHFASIGMSLMTGALQKLYDETGRPDSLRPDRLAIMHSLPKPNHPRRSLCNHWGVGLFKVPFCRNSIERMEGAEGDFNEYLRLQFDKVIHIHIPIIGLAPCWVVKWFFSINFGTSCGFTSVPGLFDRVAYVGGRENQRVDEFDGGVLEGKKLAGGGGVEVQHMWKVFGLQWRQSAVAVAMYTYRGEASVSIYANKDIVPDETSMDRLLELFHEEFNELLNHSNNKRTITPPASKKQEGADEENDKIIKRPSLLQSNGITTNGYFQQFKDHHHQPQQFSTVTGKFLDSCLRNNKLA